MNTIEYLDSVKAKRGITSDYALAKALGVGQSAIIGYRAKRTTINDDTALAIAQILDINPLEVIATANAERAKTPEMRARWMGLIEGFRTLLPHAKFFGVERRSTLRAATV